MQQLCMWAWKHGCISAPKTLWYVTAHMLAWLIGRVHEKVRSRLTVMQNSWKGKKCSKRCCSCFYFFSKEPCLCSFINGYNSRNKSSFMMLPRFVNKSKQTDTGWEEFRLSQTECLCTCIPAGSFILIASNDFLDSSTVSQNKKKKIMNFKQGI